METRCDCGDFSVISFRERCGYQDVVFITLDALRYDVAQSAWEAGLTPHLSNILPTSGWERRHTPASFTLPAHQAFFAGFLPTPAEPGHHERHWALRFAGSETIGPDTLVFDTPHILAGYAARGYHTMCIGSTGFFNPQTALGTILPGYFHEAHWDRSLGVSDPRSAEHQFALVAQRLADLPATQRVFLFINIGTTHRPTHMYVPGATGESLATQTAALAHVDRKLPHLLTALRQRGPWHGIICADHGTCFGDDGFTGHRLAHPAVWSVPYADIELTP